MTWVRLTHWQPNEAAAHIQHDLANLLLPLMLAAETEAGMAADLPALAKPLQDRARQLGIVLEPPAPRDFVSAAAIADDLHVSLSGAGCYVRCDANTLQFLCADLSPLRVRGNKDGIVITLQGRRSFGQLTTTTDTAAPYAGRGVRLELTALAAVADAWSGWCELCGESGNVRLFLPAE